MPSEKVCRDLLKSLPKHTVDELRNINKELFQLQSKNEPPREVILNFDDTVCTIFGKQEGAQSRYKGRPSFKEKLGMIANTNEILNLTLEGGKSHSNNGFLDFFKNCEEIIPSNWYIKKIRCDKGLFEQKNMQYFEEQNYEYVIKAKNQAGVKNIIDYINSNPKQYPWTAINKKFSVNEITVPLPA